MPQTLMFDVLAMAVRHDYHNDSLRNRFRTLSSKELKR
jgi:hypothetical protein